MQPRPLLVLRKDHLVRLRPARRPGHGQRADHAAVRLPLTASACPGRRHLGDPRGRLSAERPATSAADPSDVGRIPGQSAATTRLAP